MKLWLLAASSTMTAFGNFCPKNMFVCNRRDTVSRQAPDKEARPRTTIYMDITLNFVNGNWGGF